jgi:hypothetical protein
VSGDPSPRMGRHSPSTHSLGRRHWSAIARADSPPQPKGCCEGLSPDGHPTLICWPRLSNGIQWHSRSIGGKLSCCVGMSSLADDAAELRAAYVATRSLLRTRDALAAQLIVLTLCRALGAQVATADADLPDSVPMDISLGEGEPLLPVTGDPRVRPRDGSLRKKRVHRVNPRHGVQPGEGLNRQRQWRSVWFEVSWSDVVQRGPTTVFPLPGCIPKCMNAIPPRAGTNTQLRARKSVTSTTSPLVVAPP